MDNTDSDIIGVLKEDARKSVRDIAKTTGIRPSTVHSRMQRLRKESVIEKFTVKLNNDLSDQGFIAFMLLTTKRDLDEAFLSQECIKEVFGITGEYDLIIKLKFKDVTAFNQFLIDLRKRREIIKSVSMVSTINLKEDL